MGRWRTRFVFLLIIYFSGFATAVYFLAPVSPDYQISQDQKDRLHGMIDSEHLTANMNTGMRKAAALSKQIAERASVLIKERISEYQAREK
jgi:hypothetical protein